MDDDIDHGLAALQMSVRGILNMKLPPTGDY